MKNKFNYFLLCIATMMVFGFTSCNGTDVKLSNGYYVHSESIMGNDVVIEYIHITYDKTGAFYGLTGETYEKVFDFTYAIDGNVIILTVNYEGTKIPVNGTVSSDGKTISIEGLDGDDPTLVIDFVKSSNPNPGKGETRKVSDGFYAYKENNGSFDYISEYIEIKNQNTIILYVFNTSKLEYEKNDSCSMSFTNNQILCGDDRKDFSGINMYYDIDEDCQGLDGFLNHYSKVASRPSVTDEMKNHSW